MATVSSAVDLMTIDQRSEEAEKISKQRLDQLCQAWEDSPEFVQLTQEVGSALFPDRLRKNNTTHARLSTLLDRTGEAVEGGEYQC